MIPSLVLAVLVPVCLLPAALIPADCIARNRTGEQCCYTCLETLGRWHRIKRLSHLTSEYSTAADPAQVQSVLVRRAIHCRVQHTGNLDPAILRGAARDHLGAAVCLRGEPPSSLNHMVVLTALTHGHATIINDGAYEDMTEGELFGRWTGWAIIIYPDPLPVRIPSHGIIRRTP